MKLIIQNSDNLSFPSCMYVNINMEKRYFHSINRIKKFSTQIYIYADRLKGLSRKKSHD